MLTINLLLSACSKGYGCYFTVTDSPPPSTAQTKTLIDNHCNYANSETITLGKRPLKKNPDELPENHKTFNENNLSPPCIYLDQ